MHVGETQQSSKLRKFKWHSLVFALQSAKSIYEYGKCKQVLHHEILAFLATMRWRTSWLAKKSKTTTPIELLHITKTKRKKKINDWMKQKHLRHSFTWYGLIFEMTALKKKCWENDMYVYKLVSENHSEISKKEWQIVSGFLSCAIAVLAVCCDVIGKEKEFYMFHFMWYLDWERFEGKRKWEGQWRRQAANVKDLL